MKAKPMPGRLQDNILVYLGIIKKLSDSVAGGLQDMPEECNQPGK
jgi:hypothetical protein